MCVYDFALVLTFLKEILSGEMMEVLVGREVDLEEDGSERAADTAAAMAA